MPFSLLSADGQSKYDVRDGTPMLVGRAPTCDVPVFDPTVSRRHAELSLVGGGVKVVDLGSANGTFVNGEKITERELFHLGAVTLVAAVRRRISHPRCQTMRMACGRVVFSQTHRCGGARFGRSFSDVGMIDTQHARR